MNIFKKISTVSIVGSLLLSQGSASADVLATWVARSNGVGGNPSNAPFDFDAPAVPGVQAAVLSLPGTAAPGTATEEVGNNTYGFSATSQRSQSRASNQGHFFEFSLAAEPGKLLNLTTLDANFQNGGNGFDRFNRAQVRSSLDNFGSRIGSTITGNNLDLNGFDLSGAAFQGIDDITFRVIFWENQGNNGSNNRIRLRGNNGILTVNGRVIPDLTAVPEISSTLPVAILFSFSLIGRRRQRRG